jgi:adenosylcobinamide-GDP ribazoletransferase
MTTKHNNQPPTRRSWPARQWLYFVLAVTFLTRLPLRVAGEVSDDELRASMGWYPAVGLALGALGWGLCAVGLRLFAPLLTAVLVIVLLEMCTGALHLDGFMDTCDGLGSGAPRVRALEIMKDSRVGAMGVFGAVAILLVKVAALATLPPHLMLPALLIGWSTARVLPLLGMACFRYARPTGTGGAFAHGKSRWSLLCALLSALVIAYLVAQVKGVCLVVGVIGITLLAQAVIARKLGGLTGDVYGMSIELAEALTLLACCAGAAWIFT